MTKLYKNGRGVSKIDFAIETGDVVGLLGPNGSGKTTTMKVIVGLIHADSGNTEIFGHDIEADYENATAKLGCLIESPALYEYLSAYKNLVFASRCYPGVDEGEIDRILQVVRLDKYKKEKAGRFSLGMKQRLGLALALISSPELVILDEPANGLDIEGMIEVRDIVKALSQKGTTFLISSHLASEIEKMCNKVAVMHEGEILSFDTLENALLYNPTLEDYYLEMVRRKRGTTIV
jgi:ABC-2 type transport system ATP-binding protein